MPEICKHESSSRCKHTYPQAPPPLTCRWATCGRFGTLVVGRQFTSDHSSLRHWHTHTHAWNTRHAKWSRKGGGGTHTNHTFTHRDPCCTCICKMWWTKHTV